MNADDVMLHAARGDDGVLRWVEATVRGDAADRVARQLLTAADDDGEGE